MTVGKILYEASPQMLGLSLRGITRDSPARTIVEPHPYLVMIAQAHGTAWEDPCLGILLEITEASSGRCIRRLDVVFRPVQAADPDRGKICTLSWTLPDRLGHHRDVKPVAER